MACIPCMALIPGAVPVAAAAGFGIWQFGVQNREALALLLVACVYAAWSSRLSDEQRAKFDLISGAVVAVVIVAFVLWKKNLSR